MKSALLPVCLLLTLVPATSAAQSAGADIDLQTFTPAMDSRGFVTVNSPRTLGHLELSLGLVTSWGKSVLRFESGARVYEIEHVVSPTLIAALGLRAAGLSFELGISAPFHVVVGDRSPDDDGGTPTNPNDDERFGFEGQGLGNLGLHLKTRLLREERVGIGLAVVGSVLLPTATDEQSWTGNDNTTARLSLAAERRFGRVRLAANGGYHYRPSGTDEFRDMGSGGLPFTGGIIGVGSSLPFGAALAYSIAPARFELVGEVFGAVPLAGENYQPLEALAGAKLYLADSSFLSFGAGAGLVPDQGGNPDVRAFLGIVFEPRSKDSDGDGIPDSDDACPLVPEDFDDFEDSDGCPEPDNDKDGILDRDDACPNVPEDKDGFEDEDGCPDDNANDRDGDKIIDSEDGCPDDPEDYDDFEDEDGCPDLDNDNDKIVDTDDLCPNDPEDYDRFEDSDGCPEKDNDNDRIVDIDDQCPMKDGEKREDTAEVYNGVKDDDGCPDGRIRMGETVLVLLDKIYFEYDSDVIRKVSYPILAEIAKTLQLNPDITLVEVQGHTDERGSEAYNLDLSQRRAESVVGHLVGKGVDSGRLEGRGYGEGQPKDPRHNERAWSKNRRVEFHIIKRNDG
ncbi:MAG: OmpA family protein [Deltaproteobacteria bacterium]|nr:OmpA family protein [Deltaproteobacteria bacterium]